jgi:hypothetical protein
MRPIRRAAISGVMALWLAPLPALAGSQSSNSSSDCDGPRCRHVESYVVEERGGRRGWVREEHWIAGAPRAWGYEHRNGRHWRGERDDRAWGHRPRRDRDDDDD